MVQGLGGGGGKRPHAGSNEGAAATFVLRVAGSLAGASGEAVPTAPVTPAKQSQGVSVPVTG